MNFNIPQYQTPSPASFYNISQGFPTYTPQNMMCPQLLLAQISQTMRLRANAIKLIELRSACIENYGLSITNIVQESCKPQAHPSRVKAEMCVKLESPTTLCSETQSKGQMSPEETSSPLEKPIANLNIKLEVEKMMTFLLANMGKASQTEIEEFRKCYLNHPGLLEIYDKLVMKYYSAKKCREDIIRYILRRAFKAMRTAIMNKEQVNGRKASLILCKKYFQNKFEQVSQTDIKDEDDLLELFMPYKKNSKNKTMSGHFLVETFSSEEFCKDYEQFLKEFDDILAADNNRKRQKLTSYLVDCVKKNSPLKIGVFARMPWLDTWMDETKSIANTLGSVNGNDANKAIKKVKCE